MHSNASSWVPKPPGNKAMASLSQKAVGEILEVNNFGSPAIIGFASLLKGMFAK